VSGDLTDIVALRLTGQIDELSKALARAAVPLAERARLLEVAAVAAMQAVRLEAATTEPAAVTPLSAAPSLRELGEPAHGAAEAGDAHRLVGPVDAEPAKLVGLTLAEPADDVFAAPVGQKHPEALAG
jgi:hypothetical protein